MLRTLTLTDIYKPIQKDLDECASRLEKTLRSDDPFLSSINEHIVNISGKQLRSAVTLLCARLAGDTSDIPIQMSLVIELLHTATLVHDDIVDGSLFRRNHKSLNAKWGNDIALIYGDYIYTKAYAALAEIENQNINKMFAECASRISEGEIKQIENRNTRLVKPESYFEMIMKKTAILFETGCAAGALVAKSSTSEIKAFADYGRNYGLAFQIADDCLDLIGKADVLGKDAGSDFAKDDPTLPLIYLDQIPDFKRNGHTFEQIRELAISSGVIAKSVQTAQDFGQKALNSIANTSDNPYKRSLFDLVEYTLQRVK